jgi:hypothetical protein
MLRVIPGAGIDPDVVMRKQEFYHDILNVAPEVNPFQTTLKVIAAVHSL